MGTRLLILSILLGAPLAAQDVRDAVLLAEPGQLSSGPALATWGDTTAVAWVDGSDGALDLVAGDGRGLAWGSPVRVDDATSSAFRQVRSDAVAVAGQTIYVWWLEQRLHPGTDEVYFNVSRDGGQSFQPSDLRIDKGLPASGNSVLDARLLVDPRKVLDRRDDLVVLLMAVHNDETGLDEAWLNWSVDSGMSFQPAAVPVGDHNGYGDLDALAGDVEDGLFWFARVDDFDPGDSNNDVWLDVFDPVSGTFPIVDERLDADSSLLAVGSEVAVDVRGKVVAVAWPVHNSTTGSCELRATVSPDGGGSWTGERVASDPWSGSQSLRGVQVAVAGSPSLLVGWLDDRDGTPAAWVAHSGDLGTTWDADLRLSTGGARELALQVAASVTTAFWLPDTPAEGIQAQTSLDSGASWTVPVAVSPAGATGFSAAGNRRYTNLLAAWSDGAPARSLYAGGFRPQTLVVDGGWVGHAATGTSGTGQQRPGLHVRLWPEPDRGGYYTLILSGSPGDLFLGDGRNLGLAQDRWLDLTRIPVLGANTARIGADGTGEELDLVPIFEGLPDPAWAVAVAWSPRTGQAGAITDVQPLHLP